jgi:hypothetical protein
MAEDLPFDWQDPSELSLRGGRRKIGKLWLRRDQNQRLSMKQPEDGYQGFANG